MDNSCSLFVRRSCLPSSEAQIDSTRIELLRHTATLYLHFSPVMFWTRKSLNIRWLEPNKSEMDDFMKYNSVKQTRGVKVHSYGNEEDIETLSLYMVNLVK